MGDSTMQQTASTIMSMITRGGGTCADQIFLYRNDWVSFEYLEWQNMQTVALQYRPDILVINSGAHMRDMGDIKYVWKQLEDQLGVVRRQLPDLKVVWKTMNPSHMHCSGVQEPQHDYVPHRKPPAGDRFHWHLFPFFDGYSVDKALSLGLNVIDMAPLYDRIDAHPSHDCLHYCLPGPLDLFAVLLLNMLSNGEL